MKWDAVECELFVIATLMQRLGRAFGGLAEELRKERQAGTPCVTRGAVPDAALEETNKDEGLQARSRQAQEDLF